jgi:hypothetical protein
MTCFNSWTRFILGEHAKYCLMFFSINCQYPVPDDLFTCFLCVRFAFTCILFQTPPQIIAAWCLNGQINLEEQLIIWSPKIFRKAVLRIAHCMGNLLKESIVPLLIS